MKRSGHIRLVLLGGISAGILTSCGSGDRRGLISTEAVYPNNSYVSGVGYYHAPFRSWYSLPYNHFEPKTGLYFYGGQWGAGPHQSITNVSSPTPEAARQAQAFLTPVHRGGFGGSSHHFSTYS